MARGRVTDYSFDSTETETETEKGSEPEYLEEVKVGKSILTPTLTLTRTLALPPARL